MRVAPLLTALAVASLLIACGKSPASGSAPGRPAAAAKKDAPKLLLAPEDWVAVSSSQLSSGPVVNGSLQPERRADLRAEVPAVVVQVLKDNGQAVKKGELLLRLDDTAIRDSLTSAEAAVRAASQAFEHAERQVARLKTLQAQGMMSMQALEDAESRRNSLQSELVAARGRVVAARQQLARTEVRAPFDGLVSERKANTGDTAQVGKELLKVIDPSSMRFEGLVSADRMHEIKLGQAVAFRVNGFPDTEFRGTVRRIDAAANATTRQVEVLIAFAEPAKAPRVAGLFAEGRIETGSQQALMLPEGAVQRSGDNAVAWRLGAGNQLQRVALKLGERDPRSGRLPVLQGLSEGDRVLRSPGSTLADGQAFELRGAAAPASAPASAPAGAPASANGK